MMGYRLKTFFDTFIVAHVFVTQVYSISVSSRRDEIELAQKLHDNIRPQLESSLKDQRHFVKMRQIVNAESISKLEHDIHAFVDQCKRRQKGLLLPTFHKVLKKGVLALSLNALFSWRTYKV